MKVQLNPTRERPARYQQQHYRPTGTTTHTAHERSRLPRRRPANSRVAITIAGSRMRALSRSTHSEGFHDTHFSHVERSKNNPIQVRRKSVTRLHDTHITAPTCDTCHDCETIAVRTTRVDGRGLTSSVSDSRITSPHLPARARELAYLYKNERKGHISTTTTLMALLHRRKLKSKTALPT